MRKISFCGNMERWTLVQVILKAGHHGSKTSSTEPFIEKLQPQLTIFSAGKNNLYGHPHEEVKETFAEIRFANNDNGESWVDYGNCQKRKRISIINGKIKTDMQSHLGDCMSVFYHLC